MLAKTGYINQTRLWKQKPTSVRKSTKEVVDRSSTSEPPNVNIMMIGIWSSWCKLSYKNRKEEKFCRSMIHMFILLLLTVFLVRSDVFHFPFFPGIYLHTIALWKVIIQYDTEVGQNKKKSGKWIKDWNPTNKQFGSLKRPPKEKIVPWHNWFSHFFH